MYALHMGHRALRRFQPRRQAAQKACPHGSTDWERFLMPHKQMGHGL
jgi:hypothetical protein